MFMRVINTGSQPGNCYALKSESSEILLLDCGCRYSEILKGISYRISEVSGCLLTHGHGDHLKSFQNLMQSGIQIYTNDETVESVNTTEQMGTKNIQMSGKNAILNAIFARIVKLRFTNHTGRKQNETVDRRRTY